MTRPYTVPATGTTRESKPVKPYLWNGFTDLERINGELMAERQGKPEREVEPTFSFPQPLPGPPKKGGATSDEAQRRRRAAAKLARAGEDDGTGTK